MFINHIKEHNIKYNAAIHHYAFDLVMYYINVFSMLIM